ncbi:DUF5672 family protein [Sphingomonas kaistensis]|uniref:DUF5672 family protein n=1 Tax=Sphingomonas kaistensis TaxID=298708 RepID=A0ABZ2G259_9SPHN
MANKLQLPTVTLVAATSVNVAATVAALRECQSKVSFGECLLLTDADVDVPASINVRRIAPLRSVDDYCRFMLTELRDHIATEYVLVCQWDGFVVDPTAWDDNFLQFDYIGAPWPQFTDGHDVGNGGFSLRSRRLLDALQAPDMITTSPEDVAIGRLNRERLERDHGLRFADTDTAARFSFERCAPTAPSFGFHGAFNLIPILGADRFWSLYRSLNERGAVRHDTRLIMKQLVGTPAARRRQLTLIIDRLKGFLE